MSQLDDELRKVRARAEAAAAGLTGEAAIEAASRASLDYALAAQEPHLSNLERALGEEFDAGTFFMGMQCAALALDGTNVMDLVRLPLARRLLKEYIARARERAA